MPPFCTAASPQMMKTVFPRLFLPWVIHIGSPEFGGRMIDLLPFKSVQRLMEISDIMHERSLLIFNQKKNALEKGDDVLKEQIAKGRDLMSILREFLFRSAYACSSLIAIVLLLLTSTVRENLRVSEEDRLPDAELIGQVS